MSLGISGKPWALLALAVASNCLVSSGKGAIERSDLPLSSSSGEWIPADSSTKELLVRLPEHIKVESGTELRLVLRPSQDLPAHLFSLSVSCNGTELESRPSTAAPVNALPLPIEMRLRIPERLMLPGWNRVSIQFSPGAAVPREALDKGGWMLRKPDCILALAYSRLPGFPELARFPASFAEEKLLHTGEPVSPISEAGLTIALPRQVRDIHLRACAVLGARFGQLGYFSDRDYNIVRLDLNTWQPPDHNWILVGRSDEIAGCAAVTNCLASKHLIPGQGAVAECLIGTGTVRSRGLLVTGADDVGLEKALLTLGSSEALASIEPSPALVGTAPRLSSRARKNLKPSAPPIRFADSGWDATSLTGPRTERSLTGWRLPPGLAVVSGTVRLDLSQSRGLTNSYLDVLVNAIRIATIPLPLSQNTETRTIALPRGLPGRDPMIISFRSFLQSNPSALANTPSIRIGGTSEIAIEAGTATINNLNQAASMLDPDPLLERLAFVVPYNASATELRALFDLALYSGAHLQGSPAVWPDAVGYDGVHSPAVSRLKGKTTVLLGSARQWKSALPKKAALAIEVRDPTGPYVHIQARRYAVAQFESSLSFLQLIASPWSKDDLTLVAGGWETLAGSRLKWMLTDPEAPSIIYGNVAAMDDVGRLANYDTLRPSMDSLGERLQTFVPPGVPLEETNRRLRESKAISDRSRQINGTIFYGFGALVIFLVAVRLLLIWERARSREEALRHESPAS